MKSLILFLITLVGVASSNKVDSYFDFDEVEHFQTDYKKFEKDGESIYSKVPEDQQEQDLLNVLLSRKVSFQDTVLIKNLEQLGFDKLKLSINKVDQLKKLFNPKKSKYGEVTFCDPIYNDILLFKNKNKIVGFAKICFGCSKMIVVRNNLIEHYIPSDNIFSIETVLKK